MTCSYTSGRRVAAASSVGTVNSSSFMSSKHPLSSVQGGCASVQEVASPGQVHRDQVTQDNYSQLQHVDELQSSPLLKSGVTFPKESSPTGSEYWPSILVDKGCNISEIRKLFSDRHETESLKYKPPKFSDTAMDENLAQPPESHTRNVIEILSNTTSDKSDLIEGLEFDPDWKNEEFFSCMMGKNRKELKDLGFSKSLSAINQ